MFLTGALITGSTLYVGSRIYRSLNRLPKKSLATVLIEEQATAREKPFFTNVLSSTTKPENQVPVEITATSENRDREVQTDRYLIASGAAMGLAVAGSLIYPPLRLLSVPLILYGYTDIFKAACKTLFRERRIRISVIDSIAIGGTLVTGYYFVSALTNCVYYVSQKLVLRTTNSSQQSLTKILDQQPRFVWVLNDGVEVETPIEALEVGDVIVINAGEMIPVDGQIVAGLASIDQHRLTGEAQPTEKEGGDQVWAGTVVLAGRICVRVDKAGPDTMAAQIGDILNQTAAYISSVESKGQSIADRSAMPTLSIAALTVPILGPGGALAAINTNYSDVWQISAPLGVLNFLHLAADRGILIKDGRSLELLSQVDTVIFDKTGTLTLEQFHVGQIYPFNETAEDELLRLAAAAEYKQTHPVAQALRQAAAERGLPLPEITEAHYDLGYGITVRIAQNIVRVGSARFMALVGIALPDQTKPQQAVAEQGHSFVYVARDNQLIGMIELRPTLRPEAKAVIDHLRQRGLTVYIISGDHHQPTRKLAHDLGIDHYFAEVLPTDKAALVEQLQSQGRTVCFVGDGINDSIALKKANLSISIRGASTIATDTAQIVLMDQSLSQLNDLFQLAEELKTNMTTSMALAYGPSLISIGGVLFWHLGLAGVILVYNFSIVAGVANAMLPWLNHQRQALLTAGDS